MTVVIDVPTPVPSVIFRPEGTTYGTEELADELYSSAARFEELGDVAAGRGGIFATFFGEASFTYRDTCHRVAEQHAGMATSLERVARAVTSYVDTLEDLLRTSDELGDVKEMLGGLRNTLLWDISIATDPTPEQVQAFRDRASDLRARYDELVRADTDLQERTRSAEDLLRESFTSGQSLEASVEGGGGTSDLAREAMKGFPYDPLGLAGPGAAHEWWEGLSEAEREAVIAGYPSLIGKTDGLPADARDQANRILLQDDLSTLEQKEDDGTLSDEEEKILANARQAEEALEVAEATEDPITGEHPPSQLYLYEPGAYDGDGRVAISVGDLDTADDVAIFTPGIKTDMADTARYAGDVRNLYESTRYNGDGSSVATLYNLGYDAPDGPTDSATLSEDRAAEGGSRLADTIDGLRASREDDPAHLTAIGHSYGSTVTSYAATEHDVDVDDIALIGSPGAGRADDASDLGVGDGHVYVGRDSRDGVAFLGDEGWFGKDDLVHTLFPGPSLLADLTGVGDDVANPGLGEDPSSEGFGATRFEAESTASGGVDFEDAHGRYLDHDTESLYNLGKIVDGQGSDVNEADRSEDPLLGLAQDPEADRGASNDVPGESRTRDDG